MKLRLFSVLFITALSFFTLIACNPANVEERLDYVEESIENRVDAAEDAIENRFENNKTATISEEEATSIALKHASFTEDQVEYLHVSYEVDDGIPQYEVDFHHDRLEYDYNIHAETGDILSFSTDN